MNNWQDLSVLLAGCGSIGRRHARVLTALGVHDIRACDINPDQLQVLLTESPNVRPVASFETGLSQAPDIVFVLTPSRLHIPMAMQAINAGSHVFMEKPVSDTLEGVDDLRDLAEASGKKVMVGLCLRYHEGVLKAREKLESGVIGRLVSIRDLFGEYMPEARPDYRNLFTAQYSGAFDYMHGLDLTLWFANQPVQKVHCLYGTYSNIGIHAPDIVEILIGFTDQLMASVHIDFFQRPRRRQLELIGTDGIIILEYAAWEHYTFSTYDSKRDEWVHILRKANRDDMFRDEDREFLQAVAEDKPVRYGIDEGLISLRVVDQVLNQPE